MIKETPLEKSVDLGDATLEYLLYEPSEKAGADAPTMIFMHATGFMPWLWHPVCRHFRDSARIITPYFCDHREADPEDGGLSWLLLGQDVARLCEVLGLEHPYMVGHSMGGAVLTIAAGKFGVAPKGLILFEPIFLPSPVYTVQLRVEDHPLAGKSIKRRNAWDDRESAREYLRAKPLFARWDDEMLDMYLDYGFVEADTGGLTLACHPRKEAAMFMGSMAYDPWPIIPNVTCPVMVLEGENTENKGFINFQQAAEKFPNGTYRMVEDAGHLIPMEKPGETVSIIKNFFETL
ncbi:MAG: alpha/beta hydrolase [Thermodesulfobacteriota bacterium]|nr:alpha/beta hydrolase [Thermodesulfobacteriota bacterium]